MEEVDFEKLLAELEFMTDEQLSTLSFSVWVTQRERYEKDAIASAMTGGVESTSYAQIRGE